MVEEGGHLEGLAHARANGFAHSRDGGRGTEGGSDDTHNVTLVRRAFEAFDGRDLDALVGLTDPEVELFAPTAALANEGRCYRGHEGLARYLQDVERTWLRLEVVPQKFREVGNHVVSLGRTRALARDGFEVDGPTAWVWEVRAGKLCYGCVYAEPGESFMGLSLGAGAEMPPVGALHLSASSPVRAA